VALHACRCRSSWDHRVIDGASAARFNSHFASLLGDMRRVLI
jgi:pyruvate dehydrogenase E2 component (dihydrolipoamide acetyltransferase)